MSPKRHGLGVIAAALVLDQASKQVALATLSPAASVQVLPVFDLTLVWNYGVSFGMFGAGGVPALAFVAVSLAISAFLLWQMWREESRLALVGYALVVGGALGNVVDRLVHGAVVDFLLLYYRDWAWPVFNVADICITFGVGLIVIDSLWPRRASTKSGANES